MADNETYTQIIGRKIREYRIELGNTQAEFAEKIGVNRSSLSLIEQGNQAPDFETFAKFLVLSGKNAHELLEINCCKRIIVDTNIILNCPNILNDLNECCDFVYIPQPVIRELNFQKDNGNPSRRKLAGLCMTKITNLKSEKFIVGENADNSKARNNDDKIFYYALNLAEKHKSDTVYLLSNDKDFKLKNKEKVNNFNVIESSDFNSIFRSSIFNPARSQSFFNLVSRNSLQQLQSYDLTGVDVNYIDIDSGYTPLIQAVRKKQRDLIEFLLSLPQIDVNRVDNKKYCFPPISHALQIHEREIVKILLNNGANINEPSMNEKNPYNTPLMIAAWGGILEEVKLLVENGACINQQDKGNGFTALIKATYQKNIEVVRYLLENGADTTISSFEKKTALDYAYEKNCQPIIEMLKR